MKIKKCIVNSMFKNLWLKYVSDVDLNHNDKNCLVGNYSSNFKNIQVQEDIFLNEFNYRCIYIYGLAYPYNSKKDFNLALAYKKNSKVEINQNGIYMLIENAVQIPFSENSINLNHPKAKFKTYYNSKIWQFANFFFRLLN